MPVSDQGVFQDRYKIIPRVLIFATHEENVLLLKGSPTKKLWANLYNGIGGHIEKGESVKEAAHREFVEETGLQLVDPWLCAIVTINTNDPIGIGMFVFRGLAASGNIIGSNEGIPEWVIAKNISELQLVEDLLILLPKILSLSINDPPLFAHYNYPERDQLKIRFT